jgi:hypothetical protein
MDSDSDDEESNLINKRFLKVHKKNKKVSKAVEKEKNLSLNPRKHQMQPKTREPIPELPPSAHQTNKTKHTLLSSSSKSPPSHSSDHFSLFGRLSYPHQSSSDGKLRRYLEK